MTFLKVTGFEGWSERMTGHIWGRSEHGCRYGSDQPAKRKRDWTPKAHWGVGVQSLQAGKGQKTWKVKSDKTRNLVFPTAGCIQARRLGCLKAVAVRAKLDEDNFWLHKRFRCNVCDAVPLGGSGSSHSARQ